MFQPTTGEVVVELLGDEARQMGAVLALDQWRSLLETT